jgi:hypothetical protein
MARKTKKQIALELRAEAVGTFATLLTSAFGLVAAFAWNDTVKAAISRYISPGQGLKSQLIYAILVTVLAVIVSFQLGKLSARYKIEADENEKN